MSFLFYKIRAFYGELKQRNVFHVAAGYAVVSWIIIQAAAIILPALQLPEWTVTFVVILLLLGFPVAIVLAWAFQITDEGIESESSAAKPAAENDSGTGNKRSMFVAGLIGLLIASGAFWWYAGAEGSSGDIDFNSIAVLPFESLSADEKNDYFTAGMHEAILTQLASVEDLQVISRTSVMQYEETEKSVTEIAKELDVANIIEGSVQRVSDRVRITVQLIDAGTDEHLWAKSYDRALSAENIFNIQTAVAEKIVSVLEAKLTPQERQRLEAQPTDNLTAYNLYLRALKHDNKATISPKTWRKSINLYTQAVNLDPEFALAYARLSKIYSEMTWYGFTDTSMFPAAKAAAERALKLAPGLPRAHIAMGYYYYYGQLNYNKALAQFKIAQEGLPNNADVLAAIGYIQRRLGNMEKAIEKLENAVDLDPKSERKIYSLALTYGMVKKDNKALESLENAIDMAPQFYNARILRGELYAILTGETDSLKAALESLPEVYNPTYNVTWYRYQLNMFHQDYDKALQLAESMPDKIIYSGSSVMMDDIMFGVTYQAKGEINKAKGYLNRAHHALLNNREERPFLKVDWHIALGRINALLGRKEAAIHHGKKAVSLIPVTKDAVKGSFLKVDLAGIYAVLGDEKKAISIIENLQIVDAVLRAGFVYEYRWKILRDNPRFEKIIQ